MADDRAMFEMNRYLKSYLRPKIEGEPMGLRVLRTKHRVVGIDVSEEANGVRVRFLSDRKFFSWDRRYI